jgi:hypothetical protein
MSIIEDCTRSLKICVVEIKAKKPNIATKMILEPTIATMIKTHFEDDNATTKVDNQMVFI